MMKVLQIVGYHPDVGGAYTVVKNLTKWLFKLGCRVGLCSVLPYGYPERDLSHPDYFEDAIFLRSNRAISRFWPSYTTKEQTEKMLRIARNYDIIHIHGVFDYYAYSVYKNLDIPYIITPHGTLQPEVISARRNLEKRIFLSLIGKRILANASAIHTLTGYEKKSIMDDFGTKNPIYLVPNGIDPEDFENPPPKGMLFNRCPELKDKKIVLFLSRINWKKGLDDLIPAFRSVVKVVSNAHLLIVGPDSEGYMEEVNNWISKNELQNDVTYFGPAYNEDKLMVLQDSHIFVLPSYSECFPVSVIEAMYMLLTVVVTENIGIADMIKKYECGIVVKKDKKEIAQAIISLLKNEILAKKMGINGKNCVIQNYLWDRIAQRMLSVYNKILPRV